MYYDMRMTGYNIFYQSAPPKAGVLQMGNIIPGNVLLSFLDTPFL